MVPPTPESLPSKINGLLIPIRFERGVRPPSDMRRAGREEMDTRHRFFLRRRYTISTIKQRVTGTRNGILTPLRWNRLIFAAGGEADVLSWLAGKELYERRNHLIGSFLH